MIKVMDMERDRIEFDFRLVNMPDGSQIIDRSLKTPLNALTPAQMLEYTEIDQQITYSELLKRREIRKQNNGKGFFGWLRKYA